MNVTRHRLAALAAAVSALAIGLPVAGAGATVPALNAPPLPVPSFPGFPLPAPGQTFSFSGSGLKIATSVGPAIIGKVVSFGPAGGEQIAVAPGVPFALALITNNPGSTIANGLG